MNKKVTGTGAKLRGAVLGSVSTLALVAIAGPALAQTAAAPAAKTDDSTIVIVTGIRGSLQRSMNIKRNADGVVDGISAEDVGKYPDTNLADSLQRITGVSINRVDGEGEQVTVRGFGPGYNSVTVDGRIMPATAIGVIGGGQGADGNQGNTRAFDFNNIASDGVSAVQVYKTGRADIDSGGIGATINVVTLQPLTHPGSQGSITVKALTNDNPGLGTVLPKKDVTPEISGAYQWTNDSGKFGIAAFGSYQEKTGSNREDTVNTWKIEPYNDGTSQSFVGSGSYHGVYLGNPATAVITNAPTNGNQLVALPTDSRIGYSELDTKRTNGEVVLQWKPTEELTITANSFYALNKQLEARSELTNWFSQSPYNAITFDGNSTIDSAVVVTDDVPSNKDQGYENEMRAINSDILSNGLKLKYHPNDRWTFTADLAASESTSRGGNSNGTSSTTVSVAQEYVGTDTTTFGPLQAPMQNVTMNLAESPTGKQDVASISSGYSNEYFSKQTDKIQQAKFDASYAIDDNSKLSFGADAYKNINEEAFSETTARFGDWGGLNPGDVLKYANTPIKTFCLACQFKSISLDPDADVAYRFNAVPAFAGLAAYYSNVAGFTEVMPGVGTAAALAPYANGFSHNKVEEDVQAAYAQASMKADFLGRPVKILAGVRYENTDVDVTAYQNIPLAIRWDQKNNFSIIPGTAIQPYAVKSHYSNLLPSLDMAWDVSSNMVGRMSFSITDARPQYSQMYATTSVSAPSNPSNLNGIATASSGNPSLKPLVSENFDVSGEWYYGKNSYVSLGYYRKAVQNFVGNGTTQTPLFGLTDPASGKAGTRSGAAVSALTTLGQPVTTNTMSAMTVLVDQAGGNVTTAENEYTSLTAPDGHKSADLDSLETYLWAHWPVVGNSTDPLETFTLSQPINNHTANIDGFEFAIQHFFGDTGFGFAASATTVNGDVGLNNAADPNGSSQFALEGLSNTYNITGIYEKYGWSARLVYNWRDKFLDAANASQNGGRYTAAYGQWDASVNYDLTPKIVLSLEALNLNKAHLVQYVRVPTDVILYQELDTRYELGLRYKF